MPRVSADEKRYMAQNDLRTLIQADEIKKDRTRMSAVKTELKRQASEIQKQQKKLSPSTGKKRK